MTRNSIDYFNEVIGLIFAQLYQDFPIKRGIYAEEIAKTLGIDVEYPENSPLSLDPRTDPIYGDLENGTDFLTLLRHSRNWLREEGFIRGSDQDGDQLTTKALLAMNAKPEALDKPLGVKLGDAVKSAGTETGRAVICETVGQILGAAAKGLAL